MVFTLSAVPLLQQRHLLRVRIPAAAGDAVQVYAAGHTGTRNVRAGLHGLLGSGSKYARGRFTRRHSPYQKA